MSGHIMAVNNWLGKSVGSEVILHYMADEPYYVSQRCTCGVRSSRIVYVTATRILQYNFIAPRQSSVAHFFICFICDRPIGLYVHPVVAGVKIDASPVACDVRLLTESPAWG